jgi:hypothetical protein
LERLPFILRFSSEDPKAIPYLKKYFANERKDLLPEGENLELLRWGEELVRLSLESVLLKIDPSQNKKNNVLDHYYEVKKRYDALFVRYEALKKKGPISPWLSLAFFDGYGQIEGRLANRMTYQDATQAFHHLQIAKNSLKAIDDKSHLLKGYVDLHLGKEASSAALLKPRDNKRLLPPMEEALDEAEEERKESADDVKGPPEFEQLLWVDYFRARRYKVKAKRDNGIISPQESRALAESLLEEVEKETDHRLSLLGPERQKIRNYLLNPIHPKEFFDE